MLSTQLYGCAIGIEDADDVFVVEPCHQPGLAKEARFVPCKTKEPGAKDFDDPFNAQRAVGGPVNNGHASLPYFLLQFAIGDNPSNVGIAGRLNNRFVGVGCAVVVVGLSSEFFVHVIQFLRLCLCKNT